MLTGADHDYALGAIVIVRPSWALIFIFVAIFVGSLSG